MFIGTNTPLFRYHGDIDFMVEEGDIEKVREILQGTDYEFFDNRMNNQKRLEDGVGHTQGEHEVIANHKDNEFHIGFFLFRREKDGSITKREYFMQENENGERVPMVLEMHFPKELVNLEFQEEPVDYAGTKIKICSPESTFYRKMYTRNSKDMLDIEAIKEKMDYSKIEEMNKYHTTLKIVKPEEVGKGEHTTLDSAIEATEKITRTGEINRQAETIKKAELQKQEAQKTGIKLPEKS